MSEIRVTVVYALPDAATEIALHLPAGATIADAIERSGLRARLGERAVANCPVGIFGKRAHRDTALSEGDRVELYRSLQADAKQTRRRRAAHKQR